MRIAGVETYLVRLGNRNIPYVPGCRQTKGSMALGRPTAWGQTWLR